MFLAPLNLPIPWFLCRHPYLPRRCPIRRIQIHFLHHLEIPCRRTICRQAISTLVRQPATLTLAQVIELCIITAVPSLEIYEAAKCGSNPHDSISLIPSLRTKHKIQVFKPPLLFLLLGICRINPVIENRLLNTVTDGPLLTLKHTRLGKGFHTFRTLLNYNKIYECLICNDYIPVTAKTNRHTEPSRMALMVV